MRPQPTEREQRLLAEYLRWESHQYGACPVCGAEIRQLTAEERGWKPVELTTKDYKPGKRWGVLHSRFDHKIAEIPAVGYSS